MTDNKKFYVPPPTSATPNPTPVLYDGIKHYHKKDHDENDNEVR